MSVCSCPPASGAIMSAFPVYSEMSQLRREGAGTSGEDQISRNGVNRLSAPGAHINTLLPDEGSSGDRPASGGEMVVPVIQRADSSGDILECPAGMSHPR